MGGSKCPILHTKIANKRSMISPSDLGPRSINVALSLFINKEVYEI